MNDENSPLDSLLWIEEQLPHDIQMIPKYGGQAYFLDGNLVLILVERTNATYEAKGITYPFDLWRGCIFPVEQRKQNAFNIKYLFLENHPANKDWLYIPLESENFEDEVKQMLNEIHRRNVLLGLPMKAASLSGEKLKRRSPNRKKAPKKKGDKKKENALFLSIASRKNR